MAIAIIIDVTTNRIDIDVDDATLAQRKSHWKLPEPRYTSGVLAKYAAPRERRRAWGGHRGLTGQTGPASTSARSARSASDGRRASRQSRRGPR